MDRESLDWDRGSWKFRQTQILADDGDGALAKERPGGLAVGSWPRWQNGWVGQDPE